MIWSLSNKAIELQHIIQYIVMHVSERLVSDEWPLRGGYCVITCIIES